MAATTGVLTAELTGVSNRATSLLPGGSTVDPEFPSTNSGCGLLTAGADPWVPDVALTNTSDAFVSFSVLGVAGGGVCPEVSGGGAEGSCAGGFPNVVLACSDVRCFAVLWMSSGLRLPALSSGCRVSALSRGVTEWLVSWFSAPGARPRLGWLVVAMLFRLFGVENIAKNASASTTVNPASNKKAFVRSSLRCCRLTLVIASP